MTLAYSPPAVFVSRIVDACGLSTRFRAALLVRPAAGTLKLSPRNAPRTFGVQAQSQAQVKRPTRRVR
ncbi:hypothetical protein WQE_43459 [Paraburkholderia hospita]|uniref:Uncharacterized protein n=1 Tax=Paraburkholderia hospita TaxID=169430 RepID=A0ABN0F7N7_9BURK|nr:hypothetical protein WQE_43459 [Paraburkholderia hospita]OUL92714.1 hypothetical protein CA601_11610 [Paraburkholderia hospita]